MNPAFERTLGYTSDQLCSRPFLDFVHPDDLERTREAMAVLARGGELHQFENRYISSDGSECWLQWNTRPVPGEGLVCAAARDVTDSREREEQASLRRVATLVARGAPPEELFAAVPEEAAQLLPVDFAGLGRYESGDTMVSLAIWGKAAGPLFDPGNRFALGGDNVTTIVARTGRSARIDSYGDDSGDVSVAVRATGIRSTIGTPIIVEGHLWGMMVAGTTVEQPLPADTEARLASFTELLAMAIANADSRAELQRLVDEQAALRRVATLAARGAEPVEVFSAVAAEIGRFLDADLTWMVRFEADGTGTVIASAGPTNIPAGSRWKLEPKFGMATVARTGRPARIDDYSGATVGLPDAVRREGLKSAVACPIFVEGRLWGTIGAGSTGGPLPRDAERRTAGFTELLGTAIANAESHAELTASRARIVAASDEARRRIERDLHDGAQQRLVALTLDLRAVQTLLPADDEIRVELSRVEKRLADAQDELQEISRGIHPAILSERGLGPALKTLARRSPVPVALDVHVPERLPEQIEVAAYYVVSEMLTNTAKHANASEIDVGVESHDAVLSVSVRDDGDGGADPAGGSGLTGLRDRAEALGGTISLQSPPGGGTSLTVELPLNARHVKSVAGHEAQPAPRDR